MSRALLEVIVSGTASTLVCCMAVYVSECVCVVCVLYVCCVCVCVCGLCKRVWSVQACVCVCACLHASMYISMQVSVCVCNSVMTAASMHWLCMLYALILNHTLVIMSIRYHMFLQKCCWTIVMLDFYC